MIPSDKPILMQSGLSKWLNLLFFALILAACNHKADEISIIWVDQQPKAIVIPEKDIKGIAKDSIHIRSVLDKSATNILGNFSINKELVFEPVIPFTRGLTYGIFIGSKKIKVFTVPLANQQEVSEVIAIYPLQDTLPENLLKVYIQFSSPMKEGLSADNIKLITDNKDTLKDVFLDLQPELWNEERTILTLWLDPGRIKRDLQPNLKLGNPLKKNKKYRLFISHHWQNARGFQLQKDHKKQFTVSYRDSLSPNIELWKINMPEAGSKHPLIVNMNEPLDHFLLMECFSIRNSNGMPIKGKIEITDRDTHFQFTPTNLWTSGTYSVRVDSKLEDLAGNNLNKVFDRDTKNSKQPGTKAYNEKRFNIQ